MDKKGEAMGEVGSILLVFVGVIVALALLTASFGFIGTATNTQSLVNATFTTAGTANVSTAITGQELIETPFVQNRTGGGVVTPTDVGNAQANVTIGECIDPVSSMKRVCLTGKNAEWISHAVNVTYTYGPEGYIDDRGGRALAGIIAIFAALAIAVFALTPSLRSEVLKMAGI